MTPIIKRNDPQRKAKDPPELTELNKGIPEELPVLTEDILQNFKVKVKQLSGLNIVWDSLGSQSQSQCSVWAPSTARGFLGHNRTRINLGYYAGKGFSNPINGRNAKRFLTIEVVDQATIRMKRSQTLAAVLNQVFPYPLRYKQVWHLSRGVKPFYAWKPLAPDNFVALGMVCTTTDEPPDVTVMRCVPLAWCKPTTVHPTKVWDDSGAGGGKPGSIWTINSMDMVAVVVGHDPPKEEFYEFNSSRFFLEGFQLNKGNIQFGK